MPNLLCTDMLNRGKPAVSSTGTVPQGSSGGAVWPYRRPASADFFVSGLRPPVATHPTFGTDAGPRWLTDGERDAWIRLVGMFVKLPAALGMQLQRDAGIGHSEYMVLSRSFSAASVNVRE